LSVVFIEFHAKSFHKSTPQLDFDSLAEVNSILHKEEMLEMRRIKLCLHLLFTAVMLALGVPIALHAQDFRATLNGQITDQSGALVTQATITAINNATQQVYTAAPTKKGAYYIPYVVPGTYTVRVSAPGFEEVEQDNVLVQASESRGLSFQLKVGNVQQVVTVTDAPPQINTSDGSGGTILSQREIEDSPLNGRQVYSLIGTTPGSQFTTTNVASTTGSNGWNVTNAYVVGGGVQGYQQFNLNGTNITEQSTGGKGSWELSPNIDALQEVNVMTSTYDARFSRSGGGTINMVVKSGTDKFHGAAYEYLENSALNANNFQNNAAHIARKGSHQHEFGATIGGPVVRGKVLFFGSYEGFRQGFANTTLESVPTAAMRPTNGNGADFSGTGYTVYDPNTTVCSVAGGSIGSCPGSAYTRTPFQDNTIPAKRINSIGAAVLNLYPLPNTNKTSVQSNYIANTPATYSYDQEMARVDYSISNATRLYSLFASQSGKQFQSSNGFPSPAEYGSINVRHHQITASQDVTHTFSPTMMLDVKASLARYSLASPDGDFANPVSPSTLGLTLPSVPTTSLKQMPEFTTSQFYPQVVGNVLASGTYDDISLNGDITKQWGNHALHFGGEYHYLDHATPGQAGHADGAFTFGTFATQNNPLVRKGTDGFDIADMLLGYPASGGVDWNKNDLTYFPTWALYAQDDWKATRRLSLNIGVRYDVTVGARARQHGLNRGFCLECVNPETNNATFQSNLAADSSALSIAGVTPSSLSTVYGGILFAGENGQPDGGYNTQFTNVGPRFGFAYQVDPKTVIRGGYGIMYLMGLENGTYSGSSQTTSYVASLNGNITPTNYFASGTPFPNGVQSPLGAAGGLLTGIGNSQSLDFPQRKIPMTNLVSLGFQRELPDQMTLDVKYSGNIAYRLRTSTTLNPVSLTQLQQAQADPNYFNQLVSNPYYGVLPSTSTVGSSSSISALSLMHAYSAFGQVSWDAAPLGKNIYNGLEAKLDKRIGGPDALTFQLAYTYSKTMNATSYTNSWPYQDSTVRYEISPYDRTQVFTLASQWNLPIGRGQHFFSTPNRVVGELIDGWEFSSILSAQTGQPVGLNTGYYYDCNHSFAPKGGSSLKGWIYNDYSSGNSLGCYAAIPQYHLRNLPDRISTVRTPTEPNFDASMQKSFELYGRSMLVFRVDAFNLTNSVLFPSPDTNPADGAPVRTATGGYTGYGTVSQTQQNLPRVLQFALKLKF